MCSAVGYFDDVVSLQLFGRAAVSALWLTFQLLVSYLLALVPGQCGGVAAGVFPGPALVVGAPALLAGACSTVAPGGGCVWHGVGPYLVGGGGVGCQGVAVCPAGVGCIQVGPPACWCAGGGPYLVGGAIASGGGMCFWA